MGLDLIGLVGRPIPPLPDARDVILAALADGGTRPVSEQEPRLLAAVSGLIQDGIITEDENGLTLAPGARDRASLAQDRISAWRQERWDWGTKLQSALRGIRTS